MSNHTTTPRNGITYVLAGALVSISCTRESDRVRTLRVAIAKGAQNITLHRAGRATLIGA